MAVSKIPKRTSPYFDRVQLPSTVDLNDITTQGFYAYTYGSEGTVNNSPTNSVFTRIVMYKNPTQGVNQIIIANDSTMYFRVHWSTGWQAWRKVTTTTVS